RWSPSAGGRSIVAEAVRNLANMRLQPPIGHVTAVAGQNFGLRQIDGRSEFVRITENEFARLERRVGAGRRHFASAFNDRLREPVTIAEVVVCIDEWWHGL